MQGTTFTQPDGSRWQIRCGSDLQDAGSVFYGRTIQRSLNNCILDCHQNVGPKGCGGVTWVESGQDQQWCYYVRAELRRAHCLVVLGTFTDMRCSIQKAPASNYILTNPNAPAIQSSLRVCLPTNPGNCPADNGQIFQAFDGSIMRLECTTNYPGSDGVSWGRGGETLRDCMNVCAQRGPNCAGVVFNPAIAASGGYGTYSCYLKTAMAAGNKVSNVASVNSLVRVRTGSTLASGTEPVCPTNNGATYRTADGSIFTIQCMTDYTGTINSDLRVTSLRGCKISPVPCKQEHITDCSRATRYGPLRATRDLMSRGLLRPQWQWCADEPALLATQCEYRPSRSLRTSPHTCLCADPEPDVQLCSRLLAGMRS